MTGNESVTKQQTDFVERSMLCQRYRSSFASEIPRQEHKRPYQHFCEFLGYLQVCAQIQPQLGHHCLLTNPLKFITFNPPTVVTILRLKSFQYRKINKDELMLWARNVLTGICVVHSTKTTQVKETRRRWFWILFGLSMSILSSNYFGLPSYNETTLVSFFIHGVVLC